MDALERESLRKSAESLAPLKFVRSIIWDDWMRQASPAAILRLLDTITSQEAEIASKEAERVAAWNDARDARSSRDVSKAVAADLRSQLTSQEKRLKVAVEALEAVNGVRQTLAEAAAQHGARSERGHAYTYALEQIGEALATHPAFRPCETVGPEDLEPGCCESCRARAALVETRGEGE